MHHCCSLLGLYGMLVSVLPVGQDAKLDAIVRRMLGLVRGADQYVCSAIKHTNAVWFRALSGMEARASGLGMGCCAR